jgi:hypothetical protein
LAVVYARFEINEISGLAMLCFGSRLIYFRDQGPWTVDLMTGFWDAKVEH